MMIFDNQDLLNHAGVPVLRGVNLALVPGEHVILLGPDHEARNAFLHEINRRLAALGRKDVAMVSRPPKLWRRRSIFYNVYMGRRDFVGRAYNLLNLLWPRRVERAAVELALRAVGLEGLGARSVAGLSDAHQQRVALAQAMHRGGNVFLADRPLHGFDLTEAQKLLAEIRRRFYSSAVALDDPAQSGGLATRVLVFRDGGIVLDVDAGALDAGALQELCAPDRG